jgi:hypothetical protein
MPSNRFAPFYRKEIMMSEQSEEFRQQLLNRQEISPSLQEAYQKELEALLHPRMTVWSALPGTALLILLVTCTILIGRAIFFYPISSLMRCAYAALAAAFVGASALIIRDLLKRKHSQRSVSSIAGLLTLAAGTLTVIALILGLRAKSDPKSLFGAFYVFVFYFACAVWSLDSRIVARELSAREQSLRIECRLADLAERLKR